MVLFITGGTGFFGKSILNYLNHSNYHFDVYVLTRNSRKFISENSQNIDLSHINFIDGDIRTFDFDRHIDYFIHAATPVIDKISDEQMMSIVESGTKHTIDIAKKNNCKRFLFISSGAVYGINNNPMKESDECNPCTQYGISKLNAEKMCLNSDLDACIARCFAFSGKFLSKTSQFAIGNFVNDAMNGQKISINSDGKSIRSFLDQEDLCRWLFKILIDSKPNEIYNVGSGNPISIFELAMLVKKILNQKIEVSINASIPGSSIYLPNVSKIMNELGCKIEKSLEQSILEMANYAS